MTKIKEKHVRFLKEKVPNISKFLPLTKVSLGELFQHLHHLSVQNMTNNVGLEQPFDDKLSREIDDFISEIDPEDFDYNDANTKLDN